MAIKSVSAVNDTFSMSDADLDGLVSRIISTMGKTGDDFGQACQVYNTDYFHGESPSFKSKLCTMLSLHFAPYQNLFWDNFKAQQ